MSSTHRPLARRRQHPAPTDNRRSLATGNPMLATAAAQELEQLGLASALSGRGCGGTCACAARPCARARRRACQRSGADRDRRRAARARRRGALGAARAGGGRPCARGTRRMARAPRRRAAACCSTARPATGPCLAFVRGNDRRYPRLHLADASSRAGRSRAATRARLKRELSRARPSHLPRSPRAAPCSMARSGDAGRAAPDRGARRHRSQVGRRASLPRQPGASSRGISNAGPFGQGHPQGARVRRSSLVPRAPRRPLSAKR